MSRSKRGAAEMVFINSSTGLCEREKPLPSDGMLEALLAFRLPVHLKKLKFRFLAADTADEAEESGS